MTEITTASARLRAWLERDEADPLEGLALAGRVIVADAVLDDATIDTLQRLVAEVGVEPRRASLAVELDDLADAAPSEATLSRALRIRTELELALVALEALGATDALHDEDASFVVELDVLLGPVLWRATALNVERGRALVTIGPRHRARFPWLTRGIEVSASAAAALSDVAGLWVAFEEVEGELRTLVEAERRLTASRERDPSPAVKTEGNAEVIELSTARRRKRTSVQGLAAAGLETLEDPYVEAEEIVDEERFGVRLYVGDDEVGLRVVSYVGGPDLDATGAVSALDEHGAELRPAVAQAIPTLWWARFVGPRPRAIRIAGRVLALPT
jgi:hypothetical protein